MERAPKVSVLIPVFNTEEYLVECLDSILKQSLQDIEILVMDDGSTDGSKGLLEKYCIKDSRVSLFSQENSGQSVARNNLIDLAKGEYIYFMDSDDILNSEALARCYIVAERDKLDIVTFDADIIYECSMKPLSYNYNRVGQIPSVVLPGEKMLSVAVMNGSYRAAPWLLFVKREFMQSCGVRFFPGIIHEDELFTAKLYISARRVSYIPEMFFTRRVRASSTMTKRFSEKNFLGYYVVINELIKYSKNLNKQNRLIIRMIVADISSVLAYNSDSLTFIMKLRLIKFILEKGLIRYIRAKSLAILMLPYAKKIKLSIKKRVS